MSHFKNPSGYFHLRTRHASAITFPCKVVALSRASNSKDVTMSRTLGQHHQEWDLVVLTCFADLRQEIGEA